MAEPGTVDILTSEEGSDEAPPRVDDEFTANYHIRTVTFSRHRVVYLYRREGSVGRFLTQYAEVL